jgi:hypothetical protein
MTTWCRPLCGHANATLNAAAWLAALVLLGAQGCKAAGEDARECNVHADCASGVCNPDGYCAPADPDDGGTHDAIDESDDAANDQDLTDAPGDVEQDADPSVCKPNGDGTITAAEMPLGPGFNAMFRVSRDIDPFDTRPDCSSGTCVWDLLDVGGVTADEPSGTEALDGKWYAGLEGFENATYASRMTEFKLDFGGTTICDQVQYGVFEVNEFGLFLLGVVSEFEADGTSLVYDKPVPVLVFPMSEGTTWSVDTIATGKLCNSMYDYNISQTYTSVVDASGQVRTPYGDFDNVLRVNTLMERHMGVGVTATEMRTHTYVAECFTTIAAVASPDGVGDAEFTAAAEVRRLTNLP